MYKSNAVKKLHTKKPKKSKRDKEMEQKERPTLKICGQNTPTFYIMLCYKCGWPT